MTKAVFFAFVVSVMGMAAASAAQSAAQMVRAHQQHIIAVADAVAD